MFDNFVLFLIIFDNFYWHTLASKRLGGRAYWRSLEINISLTIAKS